MAYINFQPSDYFSTKLWTGDGSASRAITGVGFQPDFTWMKPRTTTIEYSLYDAVRGATWALQSNNNEAQGQNNGYGWLSAFDSDGFTVAEGGSNADRVNANAEEYVGWNWKAGTTSGLTGGTITPTAYSINTTAGFGIYQYAGTSTAGTIAHGLGVAPECVIVKKISGADAWWAYHLYTHSDTSTSGQYYTVLDTTATRNTNSGAWNNTNPTDTLIHLGDAGNTNSSSGSSTYIMYAFAPKKGFSSFGGFKGNINANGPFCYTGFRPAWILIKNASGVEAWNCWDVKRSPFNLTQNSLNIDDTSAQQTSSAKCLDILSNGFKIRTTSTEINGNNADMIYLAFAEFPLVSSNSKIGTAR